MPTLKGLKVAVTIDGKNLPEYEDKDSVENTTKLPFEVTKYIEAVPGRTFEVKCSLANRGFREEHGIEGVKFRLYIDGDYIRSKTTTSFHKDVISGARLFLDGKPYLKKMMFSDEKIDESSMSNQSGLTGVENPGTITVRAFRARKATPVEPKNASRSSSGVSKSKTNTVSNQFMFGATVPAREPRRYSCNFLDPIDCPFLVMNLKYRSREALRALDVLPKDTNPVSEERPVDQLSRDEMAEELRRLRDLQTTKPTGVKRERDPEVDEIIASARPVKIKREEP